MRRVSLALVLMCCAAATAQEGRLMSGSGSSDVASFSYETRVEPPTAMSGLQIGGGLLVDAGFHRFITDRVLRKFFGYDIRIEPMPDGMLRVTFGPLTTGTAKLDLKEPGKWSQISLPRYPPPQLVRSGDRIALDLLVNPVSGQKIVDYLTIHAGRHLELPATVAGPARDFTVEDAEIRLLKPEVSMNGQLLKKFEGSISGAVGGIYVPGHGRYLFSLAPWKRFGFRKAGEVRGNVLSFEWDASKYEVTCSERIAPGRKPYQLYVFHDPKSYGPEISLGSSDHPGVRAVK